MSRNGTFSRKTRETHIELKLNIDGKGNYEINTGIGFFNHMLETISMHSLMDIALDGSGDINVDFHHLVEDSGIVLGKGVFELLGDKKGIRRFGFAAVPLDEALVEAAIDISGRSFCRCDFQKYNGLIGNFNFELGEVFFRGFSSMGFTLHINIRYGENLHHIMESACKSFARALRLAVEIDPGYADIVPSTKDLIQK